MKKTPQTYMKPYIKRLYTTCFAVILGGVLGLRTCPANEVITSVSGTTFYGMTNLTFGYEFTVGSQPISVNSLGVWDPSSGVGLNYSHDVGLWDSSGTWLLASVTIPSGNSATLSSSGFWYEPISGSVILSANATYVLGATYPLYAPDMDPGIIWGTAMTSSEVTFGTARFAPAMLTLTFPATTASYMDDGYFGPNMDYTVVPEPTTCAILGLGMLALAWFRRNRR